MELLLLNFEEIQLILCYLLILNLYEKERYFFHTFDFQSFPLLKRPN